MSCGAWEERIALFAGGDLAGAEAAEVERHLAECAACRERAAAYAWSLETAREAHAEPIAGAHYAAVRARVMGELRAGRRPVWRWAWAGGLAMAAMVTGIMVLPKTVPVGQASRPAQAQGPVSQVAALVYGPAAPARGIAQSKASRPVHPRRPIVAQTGQEEGRPGGLPHQTVIKLLTNDPDVIIYWIAEGEGE